MGRRWSGGDHVDVDPGCHVVVQADGDLVDPQGLDRVADLDPALVDLGPARALDRGGDVGGGHGAEQAAGLAGEKSAPLFRTVDQHGRLTARRMTRNDALRMIKRRARAAGLPGAVCCHTFRATGITAYLENGGTIENAQAIAAHESPRTTKLYDRTGDEITLDEVERIQI